METQFNFVTDTEYKGNNQTLLQVVREEKQYKTSGWCTFLQAKEKGKQVKKGEHGVLLTRVIESKRASKKTPNKTVTDYGVRHFTVFNMDQLEEIKSTNI